MKLKEQLSRPLASQLADEEVLVQLKKLKDGEDETTRDSARSAYQDNVLQNESNDMLLLTAAGFTLPPDSEQTELLFRRTHVEQYPWPCYSLSSVVASVVANETSCAALKLLILRLKHLWQRQRRSMCALDAPLSPGQDNCILDTILFAAISFLLRLKKRSFSPCSGRNYVHAAATEQKSLSPDEKESDAQSVLGKRKYRKNKNKRVLNKAKTLKDKSFPLDVQTQLALESVFWALKGYAVKQRRERSKYLAENVLRSLLLTIDSKDALFGSNAHLVQLLTQLFEDDIGMLLANEIDANNQKHSDHLWQMVEEYFVTFTYNKLTQQQGSITSNNMLLASNILLFQVNVLCSMDRPGFQAMEAETKLLQNISTIISAILANLTEDFTNRQRLKVPLKLSNRKLKAAFAILLTLMKTQPKHFRSKVSEVLALAMSWLDFAPCSLRSRSIYAFEAGLQLITTVLLQYTEEVLGSTASFPTSLSRKLLNLLSYRFYRENYADKLVETLCLLVFVSPSKSRGSIALDLANAPPAMLYTLREPLTMTVTTMHKNNKNMLVIFKLIRQFRDEVAMVVKDAILDPADHRLQNVWSFVAMFQHLTQEVQKQASLDYAKLIHEISEELVVPLRYFVCEGLMLALKESEGGCIKPNGDHGLLDAISRSLKLALFLSIKQPNRSEMLSCCVCYFDALFKSNYRSLADGDAVCEILEIAFIAFDILFYELPLLNLSRIVGSVIAVFKQHVEVKRNHKFILLLLDVVSLSNRKTVGYKAVLMNNLKSAGFDYLCEILSSTDCIDVTLMVALVSQLKEIIDKKLRFQLTSVQIRKLFHLVIFATKKLIGIESTNGSRILKEFNESFLALTERLFKVDFDFLTELRIVPHSFNLFKLLLTPHESDLKVAAQFVQVINLLNQLEDIISRNEASIEITTATRIINKTLHVINDDSSWLKRFDICEQIEPHLDMLIINLQDVKDCVATLFVDSNLFQNGFVIAELFCVLNEILLFHSELYGLSSFVEKFDENSVQIEVIEDKVSSLDDYCQEVILMIVGQVPRIAALSEFKQQFLAQLNAFALSNSFAMTDIEESAKMTQICSKHRAFLTLQLFVEYERNDKTFNTRELPPQMVNRFLLLATGLLKQSILQFRQISYQFLNIVFGYKDFNGFYDQIVKEVYIFVKADLGLFDPQSASKGTNEQLGTVPLTYAGIEDDRDSSSQPDSNYDDEERSIIEDFEGASTDSVGTELDIPLLHRLYEICQEKLKLHR